MIKIITYTVCLIAITLLSTSAFVPPVPLKHTTARIVSKTTINMFGEDDEEKRKKLTRDNEPDDFFATNTDKMTDEEKIPIAIAGMIGISLPFILGLIALYSAK